MKSKIALTLIILGVLLTSIFAQPNQNHKMPHKLEPEKMLMDLKQKLDLNEDQTKEIKSILFNAEREILKLREKNAEIRIKEMDEHKNVMDQTAGKISNVLNESQKEIFEQMKKNRRELLPPPPRDK